MTGRAVLFAIGCAVLTAAPAAANPGAVSCRVFADADPARTTERAAAVGYAEGFFAALDGRRPALTRARAIALAGLLARACVEAPDRSVADAVTQIANALAEALNR